jgi:hypothetical protein
VPIVFGTASRRVLNHFQPRHPQNAGHQRQPKILGLLDGIVDFLNQVLVWSSRNIENSFNCSAFACALILPGGRCLVEATPHAPVPEGPVATLQPGRAKVNWR